MKPRKPKTTKPDLPPALARAVLMMTPPELAEVLLYFRRARERAAAAGSAGFGRFFLASEVERVNALQTFAGQLADDLDSDDDGVRKAAEELHAVRVQARPKGRRG